MKQLTKEQALKIAESKCWEKWTDEQIVKFQLYCPRCGTKLTELDQKTLCPVCSFVFASKSGNETK